jgi:hypothetical protein
MPSLQLDQEVITYSGTAAQITTTINADILAKTPYFIAQMGTVNAGSGVIAWVLWQKETRT